MTAPVLRGCVIVCDFYNKERESEARQLVQELGAEYRVGLSVAATHYVTDQHNVNVLRRAARKHVHCVALDWLLHCRAERAKVPLDSFLIDTSEFVAEPEERVLDDDDDDNDNNNNIDTITTTTTTNADATAKLTSVDVPSIFASVPAAQPMSAASPRSRRNSQTTSASRSKALSTSATVELKANNGDGDDPASQSTSQPASQQRSQRSQRVVQPPQSIDVVPHAVGSSLLKSTSKVVGIAAKRASGKFKPPSRQASADMNHDAFAFDDHKPVEKAAETIDLRSEESELRSTKKRRDAPQADTSTKKPRVAAADKAAQKAATPEPSEEPKSPKRTRSTPARKLLSSQQAVVVDDDDDNDDDDDDDAAAAAVVEEKPAKEPVKPSAKKAKTYASKRAPAKVIDKDGDGGDDDDDDPDADRDDKVDKEPPKSSAKEAPKSSSKAKKAPGKSPVPQQSASQGGEWLSVTGMGIVFTGGIVKSEPMKRAEAKAKQLGIPVDDDVTSRTTHVVLLSTTRTLKVMHGIAQRLWLVDVDWLLAGDVHKGMPLCEAYEVKSAFAGALRARSGGASPLENVGVFFAGTDIKPEVADLKKIVKLAQGKVATSCSKADVIVAAANSTIWHRDGEPVPVVRVSWLLDTVSNWYSEKFADHWATQQ
jgi:hypothetical protein